MTPAVSPTSGGSGHHLRDYFLPRGMSDADLERLESLASNRRHVSSAQTLYLEGAPFVFVYLVRSGTLKSSLAMADGGERVNGFYMAGELTGLDAVAYGRHASTATALEDTEVSAIPYVQLAEFAAGNTNMQGLVIRLMSREIVREHSHALLTQLKAEGRLAAFLLNLSRRLKARGYSLSEFHLRMTRADIGSYLGLTLETVSRVFSSFQQQRLLEVNARHIRIIDRDALTRVFEIHAHDDAWRQPVR